MDYEQRKRTAVENVRQLLEEQRNRDDDDNEARLDVAIEDREEVERYADNDVFSEAGSISPGKARAIASVRQLLRQHEFDSEGEEEDPYTESDDPNADDGDGGDVFSE